MVMFLGRRTLPNEQSPALSRNCKVSIFLGSPSQVARLNPRIHAPRGKEVERLTQNHSNLTSPALAAGVYV
jgi:hypothetical protein